MTRYQQHTHNPVLLCVVALVAATSINVTAAPPSYTVLFQWSTDDGNAVAIREAKGGTSDSIGATVSFEDDFSGPETLIDVIFGSYNSVIVTEDVENCGDFCETISIKIAADPSSGVQTLFTQTNFSGLENVVLSLNDLTEGTPDTLPINVDSLASTVSIGITYLDGSEVLNPQIDVSVGTANDTLGLFNGFYGNGNIFENATSITYQYTAQFEDPGGASGGGDPDGGGDGGNGGGGGTPDDGGTGSGGARPGDDLPDDGSSGLLSREKLAAIVLLLKSTVGGREVVYTDVSFDPLSDNLWVVGTSDGIEAAVYGSRDDSGTPTGVNRIVLAAASDAEAGAIYLDSLGRITRVESAYGSITAAYENNAMTQLVINTITGETETIDVPVELQPLSSMQATKSVFTTNDVETASQQQCDISSVFDYRNVPGKAVFNCSQEGDKTIFENDLSGAKVTARISSSGKFTSENYWPPVVSKLSRNKDSNLNDPAINSVAYDYTLRLPIGDYPSRDDYILCCNKTATSVVSKFEVTKETKSKLVETISIFTGAITTTINCAGSIINASKCVVQTSKVIMEYADDEVFTKGKLLESCAPALHTKRKKAYELFQKSTQTANLKVESADLGAKFLPTPARVDVANIGDIPISFGPEPVTLRQLWAETDSFEQEFCNTSGETISLPYEGDSDTPVGAICTPEDPITVTPTDTESLRFQVYDQFYWGSASLECASNPSTPGCPPGNPAFDEINRAFQQYSCATYNWALYRQGETAPLLESRPGSGTYTPGPLTPGRYRIEVRASNNSSSRLKLISGDAAPSTSFGDSLLGAEFRVVEPSNCRTFTFVADDNSTSWEVECEGESGPAREKLTAGFRSGTGYVSELSLFQERLEDNEKVFHSVLERYDETGGSPSEIALGSVYANSWKEERDIPNPDGSVVRLSTKIRTASYSSPSGSIFDIYSADTEYVDALNYVVSNVICKFYRDDSLAFGRSYTSAVVNGEFSEDDDERDISAEDCPTLADFRDNALLNVNRDSIIYRCVTEFEQVGRDCPLTP